MTKSEKWIAFGVLAVGLPALVVIGMITYARTRKPVHPAPNDVTSVRRFEPAQRWAAAVDKSRETARAEIARQNVPGVSVAVGIGDEIVWAEGFGWADLESRAPVTPETRFRIGHVSKALTSIAVGKLVEAGKIGLDEPIQTYVSEFPEKEWPVSLRQLMGHTAGIRHYRDTEWGDKPRVHCARASDGLAAFAKDPLLFKPDSQYRYSTYGWVLVSAAVEAVAGEPFSEFMRREIFEPAGMARTSFDAPKESVPDRATSYFRNNFNHETSTDVDYSCFAGGGALLSTASDLVRFGMAVMDGKLLRPASVKQLQTTQPLTSGEDTEYGLGWNLETVELDGRQTLLASHASRTIEGASTSFFTFPEVGIVVAVTSNMSFAAMREISWPVAKAFAEVPAAKTIRR
jgi:serine beta-lactamase-like protein LACTB